MNNRIEICGAIAAGKTTLANAFSKINGNIILEDFSKISMLDDFYSNPSSFAFETEISFTLQHYYQIKKDVENSQNLICDFSSIDDYAFALLTLNEKELYIYNQIFSYTQERIGKPKKIIKLSASIKELIYRIHNRGRENETDIDSDYLKKFENCLEMAIDKFYSDIPLIAINTEDISFLDYDNKFLEKLLK